MVPSGGKVDRLQSMQLSQEFGNQSQPVHISPQAMPRSTKAPEYGGYHLNATASSSATFIEENRGNLANKAKALSGNKYADQANKTQSDM